MYGTLEDPSSGLMVDVITVLHQVEKCDECTAHDIRTKCGVMKELLLDYNITLSAFIYIRIFNITGPLSNYLQTEGLDLGTANHIVTTTLRQIKDISRDFAGVKQYADKFIQHVNKKLSDLCKEDESVRLAEHLPARRNVKPKRYADDSGEVAVVLHGEEKI